MLPQTSIARFETVFWLPPSALARCERGFGLPESAFERSERVILLPKNAFDHFERGFRLPPNAFDRCETTFLLPRNAFARFETVWGRPQTGFGHGGTPFFHLFTGPKHNVACGSRIPAAFRDGDQGGRRPEVGDQVTFRRQTLNFMANNTPESYDPLIQALEDAADGAHTYGAAIGLVHNDETHIRADLVALVGKPAGPGGVPPAVPGYKALWNAAHANQTAKAAACRTLYANARSYVRACIHSLYPVLGEGWNAQWNAAGFTGGSLAVPTNPLTLLQQLRAYYLANPARESVVQGINCNAVTCEATAQSISTAESACNQSDTDAATAHNNYLDGIAAGRARIIGLKNELSQLIGKDDERWYAFGFDKPTDPSTPDTPANLTAVPSAPGSRTYIVKWDNARRADSFRLRAVLHVNGRDLVNVLSYETQFVLDLDSVPAGSVVDLTVTGRNLAGESPASDPVEITLS